MLAPAALPAAGLFYWVGALGVLYTAVLCAFRLLSGLRVWVLGGGRAVGPQLGAWAGEQAACRCRCPQQCGGVGCKGPGPTLPWFLQQPRKIHTWVDIGR